MFTIAQTEYLRRLGRQAWPCGAAGDCQYRAISFALYGTPDRHPEVRAKVTKILKENLAVFWEYMLAECIENPRIEPSRNYERFVSSTSQLGTWGGVTTLLAAATTFQVTLRVVRFPTQKEGGVPYHTFVHPLDLTNGSVQSVYPLLNTWLVHVDGNHFLAAVPIFRGGPFHLPVDRKPTARKPRRTLQSVLREKYPNHILRRPPSDYRAIDYIEARVQGLDGWKTERLGKEGYKYKRPTDKLCNYLLSDFIYDLKRGWLVAVPIDDVRV